MPSKRGINKLTWHDAVRTTFRIKPLSYIELRGVKKNINVAIELVTREKAIFTFPRRSAH